MNKLLPLLVSLGLLAACGTQKADPKLLELAQGEGVCPEDYNPITLDSIGTPVANLDAIPAGNYRVVQTDTFVKVEGNKGFMVHLRENINESVYNRRICATAIDKSDSFSTEMTGIESYVNPAAGTPGKGYTVRTFATVVQRGIAVPNNNSASGLVAGNFQAVLQTFNQAKVYRLVDGDLEIRGIFEGMVNGRLTKRRMKQLIQFTPL